MSAPVPSFTGPGHCIVGLFGLALAIFSATIPAQVLAMAAVDPQTLPVESELAKGLRAHVDFLASPALKGRKPGTPGNRMAADYITTKFGEVGLDTLPSLRGYRQPISRELGDNLIGMRSAGSASGSSPSRRWILLGAHYDHLGESLGRVYHGADDNASAIAILIELARMLPPLVNHPVLFVAFNTEEPPFIRTSLMGSQIFLDRLPEAIGSPANFHAVVIMDLMGGVYWQPLTNVVFAMGAEKNPALYRRVKEVKAAITHSLSLPPRGGGEGGGGLAPLSVVPLGMHLLEELPVIGHRPFSDYDAFRNAGVPFVFLSAGRTPRYHQPTDLPDTLHYERMASTVTWLEQFVRLIDQDQEPYEVEPGRIELADEVETLRALVAQASQWKTRIPGTSPLSLFRLKQDARWLERFDPQAATTAEAREENLRRLERISMRMQCLLANLYGCGLF